MDTIPPSERSEIMSRIRSQNSRSEMLVRRLVFAEGYRCRLHDRKLPGCPDLMFRCRAKVIFGRGCFWHQHEHCALARTSKSRLDFWETKLTANKARYALNRKQLAKEGWEVSTIVPLIPTEEAANIGTTEDDEEE